MIRQKKEYARQTNWDLKFFPPGVGDRGGGGGGGGLGELPNLCRNLPSRRPGLFFSLLRYYNSLYYSQIQYPGCLGSRLHGCHPDCLQQWLSRFLMVFLDLLCQLRPPAIFLSLCAHFYCSPLPGTPPALCAERGLATMEEVNRSKMVRATMVATGISLI